MDDRIRNMAKWMAAAGAGTALTVVPSLFVHTASAHGQAVSASCDQGLVIDLGDYDPGGANTVAASIDGVVVLSSTFGHRLVTTLSFGDASSAHTWRVVVAAWDDPVGSNGWSFDTGTRTIEACAEATTTAATSAPPSSAVIPSVLPGSTVIVAQAGPEEIAPDAELPVTGHADLKILAAGLIVGGSGVLFSALARRPSR